MPKAWFITGASGGLGRELAKLALSEGDTVTAAIRRPDALRDVLDAYGPRLILETLDVTSSPDIARVVAGCLARGRIDIVVKNAGGGLIGATEEMTDADVQQQIALNLLGPHPVTRAFLKPMREQGGGRIIQISSVGGQVATPVASPYHAAKWGLEGFTEGVSQEVAEMWHPSHDRRTRRHADRLPVQPSVDHRDAALPGRDGRKGAPPDRG